MSEGISRMDRFYEELEHFLNGPEKEATWNDVFRRDAKRITKYLEKAHSDLKIEIEDISLSKVRVTVKKSEGSYTVSAKFDIISEKDRFKIVSRDKSEKKYLTIKFETLLDDPSLMHIATVLERVEVETAKFFRKTKVTCYPKNETTRNKIKEIALYNKREFNSCDSE